MQNQIILSIVMPVYNHPEELRVMLDSVLSNSFKEWELLAIDDGSDENTKAILFEYSKADSRILVFERKVEPRGAPSCRNIGLKIAKGEYVCFFDSDDFLQPFCLGQRVRELNAHPDYGFLVFRNGVQLKETFLTSYRYSILGYPIYKDDIAAFCQRTVPFAAWSVIYRKKSLIDKGVVWDVHLSSLQDTQFNMDCILSDMKYAYSDSPADYGYRVNVAGSVSGGIGGHHESNLYAIKNLHLKVQMHFGHKYDSALRRGRLYIVNTEARSMEWNIESTVERCLRRVARQLRYAPYLVWSVFMERFWIPYKINSCISNSK